MREPAELTSSGLTLFSPRNATVDLLPGFGLTLQADASGTGVLDYQTLSSWVTTPYNGSASIVGGLFAASGDLAGLPWNVSTISGITTAFLPADYFDGGFALSLQPVGLGTPVNDLSLVLKEHGQGYASAYATPEGASKFRCLRSRILICLAVARRARVG